MSAAPPSSDLMEERLVEAILVSSASSHLMLLLLLGSSDLMVYARLLWTILGLSSSLATEVTHSTTEAGEGDLFEDFFDFSPLGSRGLLDLSLRSEV